MKGKIFSVNRSCNKIIQNMYHVYPSEWKNLLCEVVVRTNVYIIHIFGYFWACYPFKLKGICENVCAVNSFITRFPIASLILFFSSSFHLVIFRFIGSAFIRYVDTETQSHVAQHSSQNMCGWKWWSALYVATPSNTAVVPTMAKRMDVSLVIRFNLHFTMKLTQTLSTVHIHTPKLIWSIVWHRSRISCVPKYWILYNFKHMHTFTHTNTRTHHSLWTRTWSFSSQMVWNLPGFMAVIALHVKRRLLVNGNAFDHVVWTLMRHF